MNKFIAVTTCKLTFWQIKAYTRSCLTKLILNRGAEIMFKNQSLMIVEVKKLEVATRFKMSKSREIWVRRALLWILHLTWSNKISQKIWILYKEQLLIILKLLKNQLIHQVTRSCCSIVSNLSSKLNSFNNKPNKSSQTKIITPLIEISKKIKRKTIKNYI